MSSNEEVEGRRPLKVRQAGFSKRIAAWLAGKSITPNQISIASVVFSALSAICISAYPFAYEDKRARTHARTSAKKSYKLGNSRANQARTTQDRPVI